MKKIYKILLLVITFIIVIFGIFHLIQTNHTTSNLKLTTSSNNICKNNKKYWLITYTNLKDLSNINSTLVNNIFNSPNTYIMESPNKYIKYNFGNPVAVFQSYINLKNDILNHKLNPKFKWVLYDNEKWVKTPLNEQQNPILYESLFSSLAHKYGYHVILTPSQDLYIQSKNNINGSEYLSSGIIQASYKNANIYEIQSQSFEQSRYRQNDVFLQFIKNTLKHIGNHSKPIIAGISTSRVQNSQQLYQDFTNIKGIVSGFWLNIPKSTPSELKIAIQFLTLIQNNCKN
jgi:hypothetical protein